jgi:hypothetical protein
MNAGQPLREAEGQSQHETTGPQQATWKRESVLSGLEKALDALCKAQDHLNKAVDQDGDGLCKMTDGISRRLRGLQRELSQVILPFGQRQMIEEQAPHDTTTQAAR